MVRRVWFQSCLRASPDHWYAAGDGPHGLWNPTGSTTTMSLPLRPQTLSWEMKSFIHKASLKCVTLQLTVILSEDLFCTWKKEGKCPVPPVIKWTHIRVTIRVSLSTFKITQDFVFKIKSIWAPWGEMNKVMHCLQKSSGKKFFQSNTLTCVKSLMFLAYIVYPASHTDEIIMHWYRNWAALTYIRLFINWIYVTEYVTLCSYLSNNR